MAFMPLEQCDQMSLNNGFKIDTNRQNDIKCQAIIANVKVASVVKKTLAL